VKGTAELDTKNAFDGVIFFTYSGDADSIEVLATAAGSGEETGLFRFKKPGKVTVRATSGADVGLWAELEFTATVQEIEKIELPGDSCELKVGEELQLEPKITPEDGHMLTGTVQVPGFAKPMRFNEILPPAPTYTFDPADGIWKRNAVDALPYGARTE